MLNGLAAECHQIAKDKGFWGAPQDPARTLMLIVSEAAEALEEVRAGREVDDYYFDKPDPGVKPAKPCGVPSEMADIIIRTLDACAAWGIDIDLAVTEKMDYNRERGHMNGGKVF